MNEKNDQIKKWIEKADHDLGTALLTYKHISKYTDIIAFHCQQAVEKYLKSYILKLGLPFKKTHDLVLLLEQISQSDTIEEQWFDKAIEMQDYAVEIRYPDDILELSDDDIKKAILTAKEFRKLILTKHQIEIDFNDIKDKDTE